MKRIEFHPEADRELVEAQGWYRERSQFAAQAFALEVDEALGRIAENPERWVAMPGGERRLTLSRFPYSILYRIRGGDVFVVAIAHHKRRPEYIGAPWRMVIGGTGVSGFPSISPWGSWDSNYPCPENSIFFKAIGFSYVCTQGVHCVRMGAWVPTDKSSKRGLQASQKD